jgi:ubiquinone/menaquinone biosynthesis C-methylase UbiE
MEIPKCDLAAAQDDHDEVFRLILAAHGTQVIRALASLSVAEHLDGGALTAQQIAEHASSDPDMTYRVLRAGVSLGLLEYDSTAETFAGTSRIKILHKDSPFTLKHYAQAAGGPAFWHTSLRLPDSIRRGRNYVDEALGGDLWEFYAQNEDEARMFRAAMTDVTTPVVRAAVSAINTADEEFVVDVGGASGAFVAELLKSNPRLSGSVLDLPQAMSGVDEEAGRRGISDRMSGIAGDFFDSVPAADIYLLKYILHDWDDESCNKILFNIRRAMNPGARLFIVETMFTDEGVSQHAALLDMIMLACLTGRERDRHEFEKLLDAADLEIVRAEPVRHPYYLIEAKAS